MAQSSSSLPLRTLAPAIDSHDRGTMKLQRGDARGAILEFDRAIALNPQDAETYSNRGAVKLLSRSFGHDRFLTWGYSCQESIAPSLKNTSILKIEVSLLKLSFLAG